MKGSMSHQQSASDPFRRRRAPRHCFAILSLLLAFVPTISTVVHLSHQSSAKSMFQNLVNAMPNCAGADPNDRLFAVLPGVTMSNTGRDFSSFDALLDIGTASAPASAENDEEESSGLLDSDSDSVMLDSDWNGTACSTDQTPARDARTADNDKPFGVVVHTEIDPNRMAEFLQLIETNAVKTRKEPECVRFDVLRSQETPNQFIFYELYKTAAGMEHHKEQAHYQAWADFKESGGTLSAVTYKNDGEFVSL